jgi:hypothetical protein
MVAGGVAKGRPTKKQVPRLACATALPKPIAARASASLRRLMTTTALNGPPLGCAAAAARGQRCTEACPSLYGREHCRDGTHPCTTPHTRTCTHAPSQTPTYTARRSAAAALPPHSHALRTAPAWRWERTRTEQHSLRLCAAAHRLPLCRICAAAGASRGNCRPPPPRYPRCCCWLEPVGEDRPRGPVPCSSSPGADVAGVAGECACEGGKPIEAASQLRATDAPHQAVRKHNTTKPNQLSRLGHASRTNAPVPATPAPSSFHRIPLTMWPSLCGMCAAPRRTAHGRARKPLGVAGCRLGQRACRQRCSVPTLWGWRWATLRRI